MDREEPLGLFRILRVKDISFTVNENFFIQEKTSNDIKIHVNCELRTNVESDLVTIEINAFYYYHPQVEEQLASITVQNAFTVVNLKQYDKENRFLLPSNVLITLVSISLSHTRALFSKNIDGTRFNSMVMPLINPDEFTRSVFPQMFDGTGLERLTKEEIKEEIKEG